MKRITFILALTMLSGCATIFQGTRNGVTVLSNPPHAKVFVGGHYMGTTPLDLDLRSNKTHHIKVTKEGYNPSSASLSGSIGVGWVILDLLYFPSLIIDAVTGAWYGLDSSTVSVQLEPKKEDLAHLPN